MDDEYFPNQTSMLLHSEGRLRAIASSLPDEEGLELYSIFSSSVPSFSTTTFRVEAEVVFACQRGLEIAFPKPIPMVKLSHIIFGYEEWLAHKYSLPGFLEVEAGEVVVDCGGYVGGFSLGAAKLAAEVHTFEPEQSNAHCARLNLANLHNVKVQQLGLYEYSDEMTLNLSASSVEHSLLEPDDGVITGSRNIRVVSLADYARENGIERYDFVKIEAEGVELEVFAGLEDMRPAKLAIDVSPERNGQSPAEEFRTRLQRLGYEVRQRAHVMFARLG
jgi:FkbM family methyltransferase